MESGRTVLLQTRLRSVALLPTGRGAERVQVCVQDRVPPEILPTGKEVLIGVLGSVLTTVLLVPLGKETMGSE